MNERKEFWLNELKTMDTEKRKKLEIFLRRSCLSLSQDNYQISGYKLNAKERKNVDSFLNLTK